MPFWICGWIEVTTDAPTSPDAIWLGVVDLSKLIDTEDMVSEGLFGLSKAFRSNSELRQNSLFAERGIPAIVSAAVHRELESIKAHEANLGGGETGGFTFATWEEISYHFDPKKMPAGSDWQLVFQIAKLLVESNRYLADQIRFVVWFS